MNELHINNALETLLAGGVIAYPTESCFGLGCLPTSQAAVERILAIKQRNWVKALILVGSDYKQFSDYVKAVEPSDLARAERTWPGPNTWLIPASEGCPAWVKGEFESVALRISAHPIVHALCSAADHAIVSTSANRQGEPAMTEYSQVLAQFGVKIDYIFPCEIGGDRNPSEIRDLLSNTVIRSA